MNSYQKKLESGLYLSGEERFILLTIMLNKRRIFTSYRNYLVNKLRILNLGKDTLAESFHISSSDFAKCFEGTYGYSSRGTSFHIFSKGINDFDKSSYTPEALNILKEIIIQENINQEEILEAEQIFQGRLDKRREIEYQEELREEKLRQEKLREEENLRQERLREEKLREEENLKREELAAIQAKKRSLEMILRDSFQNNFLNTNRLYVSQCQDLISLKEYQLIKQNFVKEWAINNLSSQPDSEQLKAISSVKNNIQVVARAGSGKTSTIINRALFLHKHCGIAPHEMLLLAFNRKAAEEIRKRLSENLGEQGQLPHIMTFHALAYALVHPEEDLLYDQSDGTQAKSRALQSIIDDHLQDPYFYDQIKALMLDRFRQDWESIEAGGYDKSPEELLKFKRSLPREGLDGNSYKSFGEKSIANFLFEHDIPYKYERNYEWSGINYRPDFTILKTSNAGIIIEYFGLIGDPDYDEMSERKRNFWKNNSNWSFLELVPADLKEEIFKNKIKQVLEIMNIPYRLLSDEEIWEKIKDRAIDRFTKAIVQFIQRCRKLSLTAHELQQKINNYNTIIWHKCQRLNNEFNDNFYSEIKKVEIVSRFHKLGIIFYSAYLNRLSATREEDFDGLMQRAVDLVKSGNTYFRRKSGAGDLNQLKYIFIDEYQDFSDLFYKLVDAIRQQNPNVLFFCVGDDWQAINGFAGSDLRFFENFTQYFPGAEKLYLSTNYRSAQSIVKISNSLMNGLGQPGVPYKSQIGNIRYINLSDFHSNEWEQNEHPGDKITPVILRIVGKKITENKKVVLLSRKTNIHWYVNGKKNLDNFEKKIHSYFNLLDDHKQNFTVSTAHKYKGLEKTVVIIVDAVEQCYPLIHPDWIFMEIFGDNIEKITKDERRLFYVALSRAIEQLFIVTDEIDTPSPFLDNLHPIDDLDWLEYPYIPPIEKSSKLIIKISNQSGAGNGGTYAISHLLRAENYQWDSRRQSWSKIIESKNFDLHNPFRNCTWTAEANGLEIHIFEQNTDADQVIATFHVNGGHITRLNLSTRIAQIDNELKRVNWTNEQGKAYLIENYDKRGRTQLSDQQLVDFLRYLKSLPNS